MQYIKFSNKGVQFHSTPGGKSAGTSPHDIFRSLMPEEQAFVCEALRNQLKPIHPDDKSLSQEQFEWVINLMGKWESTGIDVNIPFGKDKTGVAVYNQHKLTVQTLVGVSNNLPKAIPTTAKAKDETPVDYVTLTVDQLDAIFKAAYKRVRATGKSIPATLADAQMDYYMTNGKEGKIEALPLFLDEVEKFFTPSANNTPPNANIVLYICEGYKFLATVSNDGDFLANIKRNLVLPDDAVVMYSVSDGTEGEGTEEVKEQK